jgi:hypothetical protein
VFRLVSKVQWRQTTGKPKGHFDWQEIMNPTGNMKAEKAKKPKKKTGSFDLLSTFSQFLSHRTVPLNGQSHGDLREKIFWRSVKINQYLLQSLAIIWEPEQAS